MENKVVLEILVDKHNDKWPSVFLEILTVMHKVLETKPWFLGKKIKSSRPTFSLEISYVASKIRFFLIVDKELSNFFKSQIYAHYTNVEINETWDYLEHIPNDKFWIWSLKQSKHYLYPIKIPSQFWDTWNGSVDPYSSLTSVLNRSNKNSINIVQFNFSPAFDEDWSINYEKVANILEWKHPKFLKKALLAKKKPFWYIILWPVIWLIIQFFKIIYLILWFLSFWGWEEAPAPKKEDWKKDDSWKQVPEKLRSFVDKVAMAWYWTDINIAYIWENELEWKIQVKELASTFSFYWIPTQNSFELWEIKNSWETIKNRKCKDSMIFNMDELSGLVHLPTSYVKTPSINWRDFKLLEAPSNLPEVWEEGVNPIWITNFRWAKTEFGLAPSDRRRHTYIVWKTWMGKSTLLEWMILDDINSWRWVAVIDPHGDLAETIIWMTPKRRTNDVLVFDPSDANFPVSLNMLEDVGPDLRPLVSSGLIAIFKKIFWDSWGPRLEHILRNSILALLEYPNSTLMSIPLMLTNEAFRSKVVSKVKDPIVKKFWTHEFWAWEPKQQAEFSASILNKVGQFLSNPLLRNILGQPKNSFSLRWAMDNKKIVIINLSKGKIWEDSSAFLGSMMVTKFQIDAMTRANIAEEDRNDFYLYVDEFQNFATDSFAVILSEARKYRLNLIIANQYIDQISETVRWAVFWNVGSIISFQVWYHDANILKDVLWSEFVTIDDMVNLRKYSIYAKLLVDWMPSKVFSADTFAPEKLSKEEFKERYEKIQRVSREKYAKPRKMVESKINKTLIELDNLEESNKKRKAEYAERMKEEKRKKHEALLEAQAKEKAQREEEELKKKADMMKKLWIKDLPEE